MATDTKPPAPNGDSPIVAGLKQKLATRQARKKELEAMAPSSDPAFDLESAKARNAREIKELEAAIKKETK